MEHGVFPICMSALICFLMFFKAVESRQMCWTCQYVLNGAGKHECAVSPGNWTGADPRMRCPVKCTITASFDAVSGDPTFLHRGCADTTQKDGCTDSGTKHDCFYSCEGTHYCNDKPLAISPLLLDNDGANRLTVYYEISTVAVLSVVCNLYMKYII